ncbi:hypothetical protein [Ekhidna sp.]|uniref:hypothetical protein n=1 Tax=Ekhidna sp. TaxID=2608089 RepID=UPI003CCBB75D
MQIKSRIKYLLVAKFLIIASVSLAQETSLNNYTGAWGNNSSWSGGWTDGSPAFLNLPETNADITIFGNISVGSTSTPQNLTFSANKEAYDFTVNDTLIVHGDVTFANKAMNLNMGNGAVFIILGNLEMSNKINIASGGTLVVSGNFNKNGSQGTYTGDGNVYAGSYSGNAQSTIDDGTGEDSSFTIDNLSDDGFEDIEEFVSDDGATPLPVQLLYFNASAENHVDLNWATATETNNDYFSIERSEDGINFNEIGRVPGMENSNKKVIYNFKDKSPSASVLYYRLKQVDFDGQYEYFNILRVSGVVEPLHIQLTAFPTVVNKGRLTLKTNKPVVIKDLQLISISGSKKYKPSLENSEAISTQIELDVSAYAKGYYLLKVITAEGIEFSSRIIID